MTERTVRAFFVWLFAVALLASGAAKAQTGFNAYIGHPVSELALRIGPPTTASAGPDGWTTFTWRRFGPTGQRIGASSVVEGVTLFTGRCVLRVESRPARSNPTAAMDDWIMESWRFVGWGCI
jgi:hypothetical protein